MGDVFEVLGEDHEEIRQVLSELEKGPTAVTGATEDQLMLRRFMTEELIIEAAKHAEIERRYLWPAVRAHVTGGGQLADRAICQQLEVGELLGALDRLDPGDPAFEDLLGQFTAMGPAHYDFEERYVWPRLGAALPLKDASDLSRAIEQAKQGVSVLPHRREWASPGGNTY